MKIGWAFTGAGHLLKESVEAMEELAAYHDLTVFLSQASEEVLKMYGLYDRVVAVTGGRYNELATDSNQKFSFPITGRLSLGKYDLLIVHNLNNLHWRTSNFCKIQEQLHFDIFSLQEGLIKFYR